VLLIVEIIPRQNETFNVCGSKILTKDNNKRFGTLQILSESTDCGNETKPQTDGVKRRKTGPKSMKQNSRSKMESNATMEDMDVEEKTGFTSGDKLKAKKSGFINYVEGEYVNKVQGTANPKMHMIRFAKECPKVVVVGEVKYSSKKLIMVSTRRSFNYEGRGGAINIQSVTMRNLGINVLNAEKQRKACSNQIQILQNNNRTTNHVIMDLIQPDKGTLIDNRYVPDEEKLDKYIRTTEATLDDCQIAFLQKLFSAEIPRNFALIGPPGTGKTFTLCLYVNILAQACQDSKENSKVQDSKENSELDGVIFTCATNRACKEACNRLRRVPKRKRSENEQKTL
jgi:flagellar biosynthesis GTPase FlhF